jgi:methionine-rich copper-binding protein CopC
MTKPYFQNIAGIAALVAMLAAASPAFAHAELVTAVPAVDSSTVATSVTDLRITFSEAFELAFTKVKVTGDDGKDIGVGTLSVDPADPNTVVIPLAATLPQGVATIEWSTVAADGHKSNGTYQIRITP